MDLSPYTLPQLKQLHSRIEKEIAKRRSATGTTLLKRLTKMAREHGLSLEEVMADPASPAAQRAAKTIKAPSAPAKRTVPVKYRHPSNRDLSWTGRGRKPHWVSAWQANGGSMNALAIAAEKLGPKQPPKA